MKAFISMAAMGYVSKAGKARQSTATRGQREVPAQPAVPPDTGSSGFFQ